MLEPFQKATEDFQKLTKDGYGAVLRSYGEFGQTLKVISTRMSDYSKQAFLDASQTFEKLAGAKSLEHAVEIQSDYAKKAYDSWVAEATKIGEMYAAAARNAYKPFEKAVAKSAS